MAPRNHAACVASYCNAILSGEIIAGRYVEQCSRVIVLNDLSVVSLPQLPDRFRIDTWSVSVSRSSCQCARDLGRVVIYSSVI